MSQARYIMIGGFLGAGKTTAVAQLARRLSQSGLKVGLIANDQGSGLVDTQILRSKGFATEEIAGGCFCCRFNSLREAATRLTTASRPDVFIAEPVGSCTDLVATVSYPLRRIYGDNYSIAPLSVLVDPIRASRIFGLEDGSRFSEKVLYIYRKQLDEADVIVVNKTDLLAPERSALLKERLQTEFPQARLFEVSARQGAGLDSWFSHILASEQSARGAMEINYTVYAEGEALLGWLNATVRVCNPAGFDCEGLLRQLATQIRDSLHRAGGEVAHLKMTLSPDADLGGIGIINLVRNDYLPELSQTLDGPVESGELILNLRAEAEPEALRMAVESALHSLQGSSTRATLEHLEYFRPGKPEPTHRFTEPFVR